MYTAQCVYAIGWSVLGQNKISRVVSFCSVEATRSARTALSPLVVVLLLAIWKKSPPTRQTAAKLPPFPTLPLFRAPLLLPLPPLPPSFSKEDDEARSLLHSFALFNSLCWVKKIKPFFLIIIFFEYEAEIYIGKRGKRIHALAFEKKRVCEFGFRSVSSLSSQKFGGLFVKGSLSHHHHISALL